MGTLILRWFLSRTVRQAVDMCRQARKIVRAQRDLLSSSAIDAVQAAARDLGASIRAGQGLTVLRERMNDLEKLANQHLKPYPNAGWRENVEVLLVTGAVVLALRTFFFQPMAIPSGSAQPTLWGITHENLKGKPNAEVPHGLDRIMQTCWSGIHYYHAIAEAEGELKIDPPEKVWRFINRQTVWVGGKNYTFWFTPDDLPRRAGLEEGQWIRKGEEFMKLKVVSGDHLFVNRMTYNFRRPQRGEIIVFKSEGVPKLIQNTHYIKRVVAFGGERVRIGNDRHLIINGQRLDASTPFFENVYGFDPAEPPRADHYSGHVNNYVARQCGLDIAEKFPNENTDFVVRHNHLLALGDNTMNSSDGRYWGDFPREKVVGKAGFVFWPFSTRFGWGYR
ncbi:MAG TPA: signal peptidase I [Verrucomicrobiae bacterium]|nr:signal peptidase I [Verrucomicrobiae bacterium]